LSFVQQPLLSANCLKKNRPQNLTYDGEIEKTVLVALVQFLQMHIGPMPADNIKKNDWVGLAWRGGAVDIASSSGTEDPGSNHA
jgi:hypothetical protein